MHEQELLKCFAFCSNNIKIYRSEKRYKIKKFRITLGAIFVEALLTNHFGK